MDAAGGFVRYREDKHFRRIHVFPFFTYTARTEPPELRSWHFGLAFWPLNLFGLPPVLLMGSDDVFLFPVGGVTHGFLGIDQMIMVTPLYIRSQWKKKHRTDPTTFTVHSILWPLVAWGSDGKPDGRRKFRIVPFYGKSKKPNETRGFVMWPFYTWRRKNDDDKGFFVFPFYGRDETPTKRSTTVMFPFYHRNEDLLSGATDTALWPFWRRSKGTDIREVRRYWPVTEFRRSAWATTEYVAWPVYRREYIDDFREFGRITWVLPFYRRVVRVSKADARVGTNTFVWPVVRVDRYKDGGREVLFPVLLPYDHRRLREYMEPVRPFLAVWHRHTAANGDRDTSAALGLYMAKRRGEAKSVRLLWGALGWDRREEGRYLRLLWAIRLRVGDAK
jgi:hypothetical protein